MSGPQSGWTSHAKVDALGVVAVLVILAGWYAIAVKPVHQARVAAAERVNQRDTALADEARIRDRIDTLGVALDRINTGLENSAFALASVEKLNARVAAIASVAKANGLTVHAVQPGDVIEDDRFRSVEISLSGEGSYSGLTACLRECRDVFPDVGIVTVDASRSGGGESSFSLDFVWYAAPGDVADPAGDAGENPDGNG